MTSGTTTEPIRGISSMATSAVLSELVAAYRAHAGVSVEMAAVGGVDAARRVQGGERFDVVVLASDAIDRLAAAGHVLPGSRVDLVRSPVAIAVRSGTPHPAVDDEPAVRRAVLSAPSLSYSTGPSGTHLAALFERWGLADELKARIVQAPPGVPVGRLVARGDAALGFQQLSELMHVEGVDVLGTLPPAIEFITIFSGAVCTASSRPEAVRAMLAFMASPAADAAKLRHGMTPARGTHSTGAPA